MTIVKQGRPILAGKTSQETLRERERGRKLWQGRGIDREVEKKVSPILRQREYRILFTDAASPHSLQRT
ncbi:unnamed protein product, partial [Heterotrigona itama]